MLCGFLLPWENVSIFYFQWIRKLVTQFTMCRGQGKVWRRVITWITRSINQKNFTFSSYLFTYLFTEDLCFAGYCTQTLGIQSWADMPLGPAYPVRVTFGSTSYNCLHAEGGIRNNGVEAGGLMPETIQEPEHWQRLPFNCVLLPSLPSFPLPKVATVENAEFTILLFFLF